jgi:hypothetical protein
VVKKSWVLVRVFGVFRGEKAFLCRLCVPCGEIVFMRRSATRIFTGARFRWLKRRGYLHDVAPRRRSSPFRLGNQRSDGRFMLCPFDLGSEILPRLWPQSWLPLTFYGSLRLRVGHNY